jgi:hypothetical protein
MKVIFILKRFAIFLAAPSSVAPISSSAAETHQLPSNPFL